MSWPAARPVADRFFEKVDRSGACWLWVAARDSSGYGRFGINGVMHLAHRVSYVLLVGLIPDGLDLDHTCHNDDPTCPGGKTCLHRRCVNPAHLEPVTNALNASRGRGGSNMRAKTHCPQGHPYDAANTKVVPSRPNARYCRECHRNNSRERHKRLYIPKERKQA